MPTIGLIARSVSFGTKTGPELERSLTGQNLTRTRQPGALFKLRVAQ
jgi:hypothetical protein